MYFPGAHGSLYVFVVQKKELLTQIKGQSSHVIYLNRLYRMCGAIVNSFQLFTIPFSKGKNNQNQNEKDHHEVPL